MNTGNDTDERDPYAPPPEGAPDRPPAAPWNVPSAGGSGGSGGQGPNPEPEQRDPWGRPRQEQRPDRDRDRDEQKPADPRRRNARIAMWLGLWALLFGLMVSQEIGIVMGVAAVVLGVRTLRGTSAPRVGPRVEQGPGGTAHHPGPARRVDRPAVVAPQAARGTVTRPPGAMVGLVTGLMAIVWVLSVWSFRWSHQDYYDCMDAALTKTAEQSCKQELPSYLRDNINDVDQTLF
ncbi:hypothetical protein ACPA54_10190 [Uniformispora flossi]|uniref:hypothetical protein n=1 Tax=Uniformispora flossi TaxID=3390723 RepID=UPI003C2E1466